jgi:hypothetical protein
VRRVGLIDRRLAPYFRAIDGTPARVPAGSRPLR